MQAQLNKTAAQVFFEQPFSIIAGFAFPMPPAVHSPLCPFINSVSKYNQVQLLLSIRRTGFPSETSSRPKGCVYLPSILAGLHHSLFVPVHCQCQVLTDASSFPLFSASHFSAFFFLLVCIIIICPERALSERGLFVLQPGTQLFSGSTVFFPSPSVQLNTPGKFAFVSDISFFLSC